MANMLMLGCCLDCPLDGRSQCNQESNEEKGFMQRNAQSNRQTNEHSNCPGLQKWSYSNLFHSASLFLAYVAVFRPIIAPWL